MSDTLNNQIAEGVGVTKHEAWQDYTALHLSHTVVGTLKQRSAVYSPQLANERPIFVWLPPDYAHSERRYPTIYMHDGQNLFDRAASYTGEWQVDETMHALSYEGLPAIIVGIPNMGADRVHEYSPFVDARYGGGRGDRYLDFLVETLKPMIDRDFRTLAAREYTGIVGSSMGGLISLYGCLRHGDIFGFAGVISPSLWFAHRAIFSFAAQAARGSGAIYLDVGGRESASESNYALWNAREMNILLQQKGYRPDETLRYHEAPDATHSEAEWARRLPDAFRFLLTRATILAGRAAGEH